MHTTLERTTGVVAPAREKIEGSTARLLNLLSFVPDERLAWSPSATSKSSLRLLTHCARSDRFFARVILGTLPDPMPTVEAFFADLHAEDPAITTRQSASDLLRESTADLLAALASVDSSTLEVLRDSPVGTHPASFWIDIAVEHRATHIAQLEYLQTVWGDLDNHFA